MTATIHDFRIEAYERRLAAANEIMCEQNRIIAKLYAALRVARPALRAKYLDQDRGTARTHRKDRERLGWQRNT